MEDFFENGAVALHIVGGDWTILRANNAELELLGYSVEEYISRDAAEFHADPPVIEDTLARLLRGETMRRYPARLASVQPSPCISGPSSFDTTISVLMTWSVDK